jgi:Na+-transporting NADH:ubiquinone oxidoreductase subunit A
VKIKIKKGFDLPITGAPEQIICENKIPACVALLGEDYPGLKARVLVEKGQQLKLGQPVFRDKRTHVNYTAPAAGIVREINLGQRRVVKSVVIEVEGDDAVGFQDYNPEQLKQLTAGQVKQNLLASGLWSAFRTRPFGKTPDPTTLPHSIFITAMDTRPLAADPVIIIREYAQDFADGLKVIARIADVPVFICKGAGEIPLVDDDHLKVVEFNGPHPAGLAGTHIHCLDPASAKKTVWHINYQDVIAVGKLFNSGQLRRERIIALAGPGVLKPRLIRTYPGADIESLTGNELASDDQRIISGSVLSGRHAKQPVGYLGRFHNQVSVINEGSEKISLVELLTKQIRVVNTSLNGRRRAIIPLESF